MTGVERTASATALTANLAALEPSSTSTAVDLAMTRYAEGDDAAFSEVFAGIGPRLNAFLRRLCGSEELAYDLTQETFLRMHRARGSFVRGHGVIPWAYAIARNCFVSHVRSAKFKAGRRAVDILEHEEYAGVDASAEETAAARQTAEIVEDTLSRMSVANREAFVLLRFEGQSVAAAAQILGTTEGAVKLRAFRAYELLREALRGADVSATRARGTARRTARG